MDSFFANPSQRCQAVQGRACQRGSVLLIVVVLLLLASLFVVFALNVGRFEQRTSGNDLRAKLAQELAEAGLAQGFEYFNANPAVLKAIDTNWVLCGATETMFPCGAVSRFGSDGVTPRRGRMYAYRVTGSAGNQLTERLVSIPQPVAATGGFAAAQQVGAVLCRVKIPTGPGASTGCATNDTEASSTWVLTVVSKGMLTGEGSSATVTQTVGAYNIFAFNPGIPPLVASGSVSVGGGLQIVAAPNAGGTGDGSGVPVSVWTRAALQKSGTPNTCYVDDFLRQGGSSSGPAYYEGIMVCHTCQCPGGAALSYPKSGGQACQGMDIVDIDNNEPNDCGVAPNLDIKREEFPEDLFAFVFGQRAWTDVNRNGVAPASAGGVCRYDTPDCHFAEVRRISACTYRDPVTGASVTASLPEDTCYLLNIKNKIHIGDGVNDAAECTALQGNQKVGGAPLSGVVWIHPQSFAGLPGYDCLTALRNANQLGSPSNPIGLIYDGVLTQVHFQLYGLLFVREPNATTTLNQATGGSAELGLNAGATIYGAAVVQGQITSGGGGTAAIVYNKDVLFTLINNPSNFSPESLPGSWTDRLRY